MTKRPDGLHLAAAVLKLILALCLLPLGTGLAAESAGKRAISGNFSEGFEDIAELPGRGWRQQNNSQPEGISGWFQGNDAVFTAHAGPDDSYIGASFDNAAGLGTISNWLLTPEMVVQNGTRIRFWTRSDQAAINPFPDRLEVRLSTSGASTNVGATATSVGDFTDRRLAINESLGTEYPRVWTEYEFVLDNLAQPTTGRIGFRYFVENSGPLGDNGTYIGIDTVSVTQPAGDLEDVIFTDRFEPIEQD